MGHCFPFFLFFLCSPPPAPLAVSSVIFVMTKEVALWPFMEEEEEIVFARLSPLQCVRSTSSSSLVRGRPHSMPTIFGSTLSSAECVRSTSSSSIELGFVVYRVCSPDFLFHIARFVVCRVCSLDFFLHRARLCRLQGNRCVGLCVGTLPNILVSAFCAPCVYLL